MFKRCLIINYCNLPEEVCEALENKIQGNDTYIRYWPDIHGVRDKFDKWFIKQKFDLKNVDLVLIDISW